MWQQTKPFVGLILAGARVALTQNGGGWLDGDNVANAVHIFTA